jgi:hypothetical protein
MEWSKNPPRIHADFADNAEKENQRTNRSFYPPNPQRICSGYERFLRKPIPIVRSSLEC